MNASDDSFEWVSVIEASRRLKLSTSEVRRRIRVGTLTGERQPRGPWDTRDRFMVQMPVVETTPNERTDDALPDAQLRADSGGWSRVFDLLERANTVIDRQADEIGTLRERAARAETERDSALAERDRARQFQQD